MSKTTATMATPHRNPQSLADQAERVVVNQPKTLLQLAADAFMPWHDNSPQRMHRVLEEQLAYPATAYVPQGIGTKYWDESLARNQFLGEVQSLKHDAQLLGRVDSGRLVLDFNDPATREGVVSARKRYRKVHRNKRLQLK